MEREVNHVSEHERPRRFFERLQLLFEEYEDMDRIEILDRFWHATEVAADFAAFAFMVTFFPTVFAEYPVHWLVGAIFIELCGTLPFAGLYYLSLHRLAPAWVGVTPLMWKIFYIAIVLDAIAKILDWILRAYDEYDRYYGDTDNGDDDL